MRFTWVRIDTLRYYYMYCREKHCVHLCQGHRNVNLLRSMSPVHVACTMNRSRKITVTAIIAAEKHVRSDGKNEKKTHKFKLCYTLLTCTYIVDAFGVVFCLFDMIHTLRRRRTTLALHCLLLEFPFKMK